MAVQISTAANPVVKNVVVDLDANLVVETAATASQYVYAVEITNGSAEAVYLHIIKATQNSNTASAHTTQLYCASNTSCYYYFPMKYAVATGIQFYVSQSAGGGNAAEAPSDTVSVKFGITAQ